MELIEHPKGNKYPSITIRHDDHKLYRFSGRYLTQLYVIDPQSKRPVPKRDPRLPVPVVPVAKTIDPSGMYLTRTLSDGTVVQIPSKAMTFAEMLIRLAEDKLKREAKAGIEEGVVVADDNHQTRR